MLAFGVVLVILGVASFVLPLIGYPVAGLDAYQPWIGIIVAALGLITVLWGARRIRSTSTVVDTD